MTKLQVIVHPVKKEFRRKHCGFDHDTPDDFVKSQVRLKLNIARINKYKCKRICIYTECVLVGSPSIDTHWVRNICIIYIGT